MTFTTQTETIRSGTVSIQFYLPASATVGNDVFISSLGSLKFDFDIPQNSEEPTAIGAKPGSVNVGLIQRTRSRELVTAFSTVAAGERFLAIFNFTERDSGISGAMPLYFERSSIGYNELEDVLSVELHPIPLVTFSSSNDGTYSEKLISEYFAGDYDADLSAPPTVYNRTDIVAECIEASAFVFNALELMTQRTSPHIHTNLAGASYAWYITNIDDYTFTQMLGVIASLQGSVYGAFFDELFFVQRNLAPPSSPGVTLGWSVVENIELDSFYASEFYSVKVTMDASSVGGDAINNYGEKRLNVSFASNGLFKGNFPSSGNVSPSVSPDGELIDDGHDSYVSALGVEGNTRLNVTLHGFNDIKPYSKIEFDSSVPTEYQGKTFTISSIEYNFITHKVNLKIYEI